MIKKMRIWKIKYNVVMNNIKNLNVEYVVAENGNQAAEIIKSMSVADNIRVDVLEIAKGFDYEILVPVG